jgi:hypothetical protein
VPSIRLEQEAGTAHELTRRQLGRRFKAGVLVGGMTITVGPR